MANGGSKASDGAPWWVRFISTWGLGTALAVYLVWFLTNHVILDSQAGQETNAEILELLREHNRETRAADQAAAASARREILIMRRICSNTAETSEDRALCFDDR